MRTHLVLALFLASTAAACVDSDLADDAPIDDAPTDDAPAGEVDVFWPACAPTPTPPPITWSYSLEPGEEKTVVDSSYGTNGCAGATFAYSHATGVTATLGTSISVAQCTQYVIAASIYVKDDAGVWTKVKSDTATGQVDGSSCVEPSISYTMPTTLYAGRQAAPQMRVFVKAQRTSCQGMYCAVTYGAAVQVTGKRHELPPINL